MNIQLQFELDLLYLRSRSDSTLVPLAVVRNGPLDALKKRFSKYVFFKLFKLLKRDGIMRNLAKLRNRQGPKTVQYELKDWDGNSRSIQPVPD